MQTNPAVEQNKNLECFYHSLIFVALKTILHYKE